ncbi:hypothetical protein M8494_20735 [Serratia ureilytica]
MAAQVTLGVSDGYADNKRRHSRLLSPWCVGQVGSLPTWAAMPSPKRILARVFCCRQSDCGETSNSDVRPVAGKVLGVESAGVGF